MSGYIVGYELNQTYGQISYWGEGQSEPQTVELMAEKYQLPMLLAFREDCWYVGSEARRMQAHKEGVVIDDLYQKAVRHEKVVIAQRSYEAVWLLAKYIELTLRDFLPIKKLVFTLPKLNVDIVNMFKGIGQRIGVAKADVMVLDNKESFFNYMFYQPKELWQYEAALFYCDRYEVRAYMLRKLRTGFCKGANVFVTVEEVANAQMKELAAIYPVLNVDRARDADAQFKQFIQGVFNKKLVSSVFLVGEGFENNWYPASLKVLCNGRRAFLGNNLYSKGACYAGHRQTLGYKEGPVYLDETKMTEQICLRVRSKGQEEWMPITSWGSHWYEADTQMEVLMQEPSDVEIHVESLANSKVQVYTVPMDALPKRSDYSIRLQIQVMFVDENTCRICFRDMGFGEFYPASDFTEEVEIHLGGSNGQFNSLS